MTRRLGKLGADIWRRAQGIDHRPVLTEHETKSISKEVTFAKDVADEAELKLTLRRLSDGVGRQARKAGLAGSNRQDQAALDGFHHLEPTNDAGEPQPI